MIHNLQIQDSPKHQSMRKSSDYDSLNCDHYDKKSLHYILRLLDNSIGKNFSKVYSKICSKFKKKKNYYFRKEFLKHIDSYYMPNKEKWRKNGYYIDKNNIIRTYTSTKKKRVFILFT